MVYATLVVRRASSLNFMISKPKLSTQLLQSQNRRSCTLATTPFPNCQFFVILCPSNLSSSSRNSIIIALHRHALPVQRDLTDFHTDLTSTETDGRGLVEAQTPSSQLHVVPKPETRNREYACATG